MLYRSGLPGWLRSLLAVLTVVASFMHLTRSSGAGGLGTAGWLAAPRVLPGNASGPAHPGHASGYAAPGPLTQKTGCGHMRHGQAEAAAGSPQHGQPDHGDHHQAAHCPFCLTSAFALEAGLAGLPQGPPGALPQPIRGAETYVVVAISHADARAPPFEL